MADSGLILEILQIMDKHAENYKEAGRETTFYSFLCFGIFLFIFIIVFDRMGYKVINTNIQQKQNKKDVKKINRKEVKINRKKTFDTPYYLYPENPKKK